MRQASPHHPLTRTAPWLLLLLLPLLVFWRVVLFRGVFFILDTMILNHPLRVWCAERLRAGEWPLWSPEIACGWPVFAEGQAGVLYFPNWPFFALLEPHFAISFSTVFHFGLAGIFVYGYLRSLHISRAASLFGALSFQWSGFLVQRALFLNLLNTLVWLPALCWLTERWRNGFTCPEGVAPTGHGLPDGSDRTHCILLSRRRFTATLMTGAALASVLAGHPQAAAYSLIFWAIYTFCRLTPRDGRSEQQGLLRSLCTVRFVIPLVIIPILVGGLAAVQLLPTMELSAESMRARAVPRHLFMLGSLPPEKLATVILPGYFGSPADSTYWAWDAGPRWEMDAYTGVLPLIFALLAAVAVRRNRGVSAGKAKGRSSNGHHRGRPFPLTFHAAAALLALLLAMGKYTPLGILVHLTPVFNHFRIPARFTLVFAFSAAVLAAYGLHAILEALRERERAMGGINPGAGKGLLLFDAETTIRDFRRLAAVLALAFAGLIVVIAAANGTALLRPAGLLSGRSALFDLALAGGMLAAAVLLVAGSGLWSNRPLKQAVSQPKFGGRHWWSAIWRRPVPLVSVIILLTLVDLGIHGRGAMPLISPDAYTDVPKTVSLIRDLEKTGDSHPFSKPGTVTTFSDTKKPGTVTPFPAEKADTAETGDRFRIAGLVTDGNSPLDWHSGWLNDQQSYRRYFSTLHMYGPAVFGLETVCFDGWSPLHLRLYRELNRILGDRIYDLLGVRYLTVPDNVIPEPEGSYEPLMSAEGFCLYRNRDPLPRAWLVHKAEVIPDLSGSLRRLGDPLFDPRAVVILASEPSAGNEESNGERQVERIDHHLPAADDSHTGPSGSEHVMIDHYTDRRVEIALTADTPGYLVLSDTWYPGWEASLDARPVPLLRANQAFRAVRVPTGPHRVSFVYRPASLVIGLWITVLSGLFLLPLTVWAAGRGGGHSKRGKIAGTGKASPTAAAGAIAESSAADAHAETAEASADVTTGKPAVGKARPAPQSHRRLGRWLALALLGFLLLSIAFEWSYWKSSWKALKIPETGAGAARANWDPAGPSRPGAE